MPQASRGTQRRNRLPPLSAPDARRWNNSLMPTDHSWSSRLSSLSTTSPSDRIRLRSGATPPPHRGPAAVLDSRWASASAPQRRRAAAASRPRVCRLPPPQGKRPSTSAGCSPARPGRAPFRSNSRSRGSRANRSGRRGSIAPPLRALEAEGGELGVGPLHAVPLPPRPVPRARGPHRPSPALPPAARRWPARGRRRVRARRRRAPASRRGALVRRRRLASVAAGRAGGLGRGLARPDRFDGRVPGPLRLVQGRFGGVDGGGHRVRRGPRGDRASRPIAWRRPSKPSGAIAATILPCVSASRRASDLSRSAALASATPGKPCRSRPRASARAASSACRASSPTPPPGRTTKRPYPSRRSSASRDNRSGRSWSWGTPSTDADRSPSGRKAMRTPRLPAGLEPGRASPAASRAPRYPFRRPTRPPPRPRLPGASLRPPPRPRAAPPAWTAARSPLAARSPAQ